MLHFANDRRHVWIFAGLMLITFIAALFYFRPLFFSSPQKKIETPAEKTYEYYIIIDGATGMNLMYLSTVVPKVGDEVVSESNKRYIIMRIEENRAYAQYEETLTLPKPK